ncbi:hypothetical protein KBI33_02590 [Candidatus Shapirobacteria bacterium]|nr:hypothetical protein [Candidatus Shapirobacteria bacterium]
MKRNEYLILGIVLFLAAILAIAFSLSSEKAILRSGAQAENEPVGVEVIDITEQKAVVVWTTQVPTLGLVSYGTSPTDFLLVSAETVATTDHRIELTGLLPETNYFFVIRIGQETFDNAGQPYAFFTKKYTITPTTSENKELTPTLSLPLEPTAVLVNEEEIEKAMGTSNADYDLNKDGVVNALDLILFRNHQY